jgi:hypothetical protein
MARSFADSVKHLEPRSGTVNDQLKGAITRPNAMPQTSRKQMISDFIWIWVGVVSLWVVISVARRIGTETQDQ